MERDDNVDHYDDYGFNIDDPRDAEVKYNLLSKSILVPGKKTLIVKIPKSVLKDKKFSKLPYLTKKSIAKDRAVKLGLSVNWRDSTIESIELDIKNALIEKAKNKLKPKKQLKKVVKSVKKPAKKSNLHPSTIKSIAYQKAKSLGLDVRWSDSINYINDMIDQYELISYLESNQLEEFEEKEPFESSDKEFTGSKLMLITYVLVKLGGRIHYDDVSLNALRNNMAEEEFSKIYDFLDKLMYEFFSDSITIRNGVQYANNGYSDPGSYLFDAIRASGKITEKAIAGGESDGYGGKRGGIKLNINVDKEFRKLNVKQLNDFFYRRDSIDVANAIYDMIGFIYVIKDDLLYVNRVPEASDIMDSANEQIRRALYTESNVGDPWFVIGVEGQEIINLDPQYFRDSDFSELMFGRVGDQYQYITIGGKTRPYWKSQTAEERESLAAQITKDLITPIQANPDISVEDSDLLRNDCVYKVVKQIVDQRQSRKELGYVDILHELSMDNENSGCSLNQLISFCAKYKINLGVINDIGEVLVDVRYNKKAGLFGRKSKLSGFSRSKVCHFYLIKDVSFIKRVFKNQLECNVINDVSIITTLKCTVCNEIFPNTTTMAKHKLTHEKRVINDIDDFSTELVNYIVANNRYPILNQSLTSFADKKSIYQMENESVSLDGKTWYSSYGMYGIDLINKMYINIQSQRGIGNSFLFDNHCTAWVETFAIKDDNMLLNNKIIQTDSTVVTSGYAYDVTRCYTAIMLEATLPIISSVDTETNFSGEFTPGSFYLCPLVNGNDMVICNDVVSYVWYPCELAAFFVESNIFTTDAISKEINPSKTINLGAFVDTIYELPVDDSIKKEIINKTTGCLAIDKVKNLGVPKYIESAEDLARAVHLAKASKRHLEVKSLRYDAKLKHKNDIHNKLEAKYEDKLLTSYIIRLDDAAPALQSFKPIYNYIVGYGQYVMRRAKRMGKLQNAICLSIKTDEIMFDKPVELTSVFKHELFGQFKPAEMKPLVSREYTNKYGIMPCEQVGSKYKSIKKLTPNRSCLITGMPGCGKSYMWRQFRNGLIESEKVLEEEIAETSFQNNVIRNISDQAKTLHTLLSIDEKSGGKTRLKLFRRFNKIRYIYIDECQMMPAAAISILVWLKRNMKQLRFVLSGDFDQWLSIGSEYQMDNSNILYLTNKNHLRIEGNQRISDKLYLKAIAAGMDQAFKYLKNNTTEPKYYITYYSNKKIDNNYIMLNYHIYNATYGTNMKTNEIFEPRLMLPVVCIMNNRKLGLIKGCHYTVVGIGYEISLTISSDFYDPERENECENKIYLISYKLFHQYFELGFAFTCHKTIGLTIKAPYCIVNNVFSSVKKTRCILDMLTDDMLTTKLVSCAYGAGKVKTGHEAKNYGYKSVTCASSAPVTKSIITTSTKSTLPIVKKSINTDDVKRRYAYVALTRCNDPANVTIKDNINCDAVDDYVVVPTCQNMPLAHYYDEPVSDLVAEEKIVMRKRGELNN